MRAVLIEICPQKVPHGTVFGKQINKIWLTGECGNAIKINAFNHGL
jgi:hypothetical protein